MDTILVANAGSSSVKFQVFEIEQGQRLRRQLKGQVDGIGTRPHLRATAADGRVLADRTYSQRRRAGRAGRSCRQRGHGCAMSFASIRSRSAIAWCMADRNSISRSL